MPNYDSLTHFKASEFEHPDKMDQEFLAKLDWARSSAGISMKITSDWRSKEDSKAHWTGKGVDFACTSSVHRFAWVQALTRAGFRRIGVYDKHIHVDLNTKDEGFPQNVLWVGKSI